METFTPWNPDPMAAARVKDPLPAPRVCRHLDCDAPVRITAHADIYDGRSFGEWPWVYCCEGCGARVGMHPYTDIPLGTLAREPLRKLREHCKQPFEKLWQSGMMGRSEAYRWLAQQMGLEPSQCHYGLFDEPECDRARAICEARLELVPGTAMSQAFKQARRRKL